MKVTTRQRATFVLLPLWILGLVFISPGQAATASKSDLSPSARILLQKVRAAMEEEDYLGAIALIRDRQKKPPCDHPKVCLALGNCHLLLKQYPQAETAYTAALGMDPELMDARLNLAKVYTDTNNYRP